MIVRKLTVAEIEREPNLAELLNGYAQESAIIGMPGYNAQIESYRSMEALHILHVFGSYSGQELTGFLCLLLTFIPHYGVKIATTESYYVSQEHRKSGAGLALLREAELCAAEYGAAGFFISAPIGGKLAQVMEAMPAYRETNRVFFRKLTP